MSNVSAATFRSRYLANPQGALLHVQEWGSGDDVCVLLHGSGDGAYIWAECVDSLAHSRRVVAPDLRGHGDSQWDSYRSYSIQSYVADVRHVLDEFEVNRCVLIGHSLGGVIAIHVAAAVASRVAGLVLVDCGPGMNQVARAYAREKFLEQFRHYDSVAEYAALLAQGRPMASAAALESIAAAALRRCSHGGFELKGDPAIAGRQVDAFDDTGLDALLDRIDCPALVIRGHASAMFSMAHAERTTQRLRHGLLHTVGNAGHAVMTDNPAAFTAVVTRFLASLKRAELEVGSALPAELLGA